MSWNDLLTDTAAEEDAKKWFKSLGLIFTKIYFYFAEPFRHYLFPVLERIEHEELFKRVLSVVNLYPYPGVNFIEEKPQFNSLEMLIYTLRQMYSYVRGEDIRKPHLIDATITNYCIATRLLAPVILSTPELETDKLFEKLVSPRFFYALKMFYARRRFEYALKFKFKGVESMGTVDTVTLSELGGVSYPYIIKLIKTGKLKAKKAENGKHWEIDIIDAVEWLLTRPNCPNWLKKLQG